MDRAVTRTRAFTLVEVMLVLVIIALIAGVVIFTVGGTPDKAKRQTTEIKLQKIQGAITRFQLDTDKYPPAQEDALTMLVTKPEDEEYDGWAGPYLSAADLKDAYGNEVNYEFLDDGGDGDASAQKYRLWSNGPNGENDNGEPDDILPPSATATEEE
jgi:general secretion pathway protein G